MSFSSVEITIKNIGHSFLCIDTVYKTVIILEKFYSLILEFWLTVFDLSKNLKMI